MERVGVGDAAESIDVGPGRKFHRGAGAAVPPAGKNQVGLRQRRPGGEFLDRAPQLHEIGSRTNPVEHEKPARARDAGDSRSGPAGIDSRCPDRARHRAPRYPCPALDAGAGKRRRPRRPLLPRKSLQADPRRADPADNDRNTRVASGKQRRFVAEPSGRRAAAGGRDALGVARPAAVAAGDDGGPRAEGGQFIDQPGDKGRLAGAADAEVANADAGHGEAPRLGKPPVVGPGARPGRQRVKRRCSPQHRGGGARRNLGSGTRCDRAGRRSRRSRRALSPFEDLMRGAGNRFDSSRERHRNLECAAAGGAARTAFGEQHPTALEERVGIASQKTAAGGQQRPALVLDMTHVRPEDDRHAVIRRLEQIVPAGSPQVPPTQATSAAA